jgi:hypothetical protein
MEWHGGNLEPKAPDQHDNGQDESGIGAGDHDLLGHHRELRAAGQTIE